MGLTPGELNLFTLDGYVEFVELWAPDPDGERDATPDDIKALFG